MGLDPSSTAGKNKLINGVRFEQCKEMYNLLTKEQAAENAKKLLFKGEFVSQTKLSNGFYEIIVKDKKTNEQKAFKAKEQFDQNSVKNYLPGWEMTVEYEIVTNTKTKKQELYIKDAIQITTTGFTRVNNHK
jgi:hypothetical protein